MSRPQNPDSYTRESITLDGVYVGTVTQWADGRWTAYWDYRWADMGPYRADDRDEAVQILADLYEQHKASQTRAAQPAAPMSIPEGVDPWAGSY